MEYYDIYQRRLNRYGNDYQSRMQTKREKQFELYLKRSVYKIEFDWDHNTHVGSFEKYKQDETESLHYLLTRVGVNIPGGTILQLPDKDGNLRPWMVYYLEQIKASGYNRYIMLRMTHLLKWKDREGLEQSSWAYMYGQEDNMLKNEIRSRSRMDTLYAENLKMSFFVMPRNEYIKRDTYIEIGEDPFREAYRVTGFDIQSTEGVEYVTVDPIYLFDLTAAPAAPSANDPEFYWLEGGQIDGNNQKFR